MSEEIFFSGDNFRYQIRDKKPDKNARALTGDTKDEIRNQAKE